MPPRTCEADVEEPPLLGDLVVCPGAARRKPARLQARQEDRVELEPLRAVVREQVDAARCLAREPRAELVDVLRFTVASGNERADSHEQAQVLLPRLLALAEPWWESVEQALLAREPRYALAATSTSLPRSPFRSCRAASRSSSAEPWNGISAAANASSKSADCAFRR